MLFTNKPLLTSRRLGKLFSIYPTIRFDRKISFRRDVSENNALSRAFEGDSCNDPWTMAFWLKTLEFITDKSCQYSITTLRRTTSIFQQSSASFQKPL